MQNLIVPQNILLWILRSREFFRYLFSVLSLHCTLWWLCLFWSLVRIMTEKKGRQIDSTVVTSGTVSCRNDNLRCHQWRQCCQFNHLLFSVITWNCATQLDTTEVVCSPKPHRYARLYIVLWFEYVMVKGKAEHIMSHYMCVPQTQQHVYNIISCSGFVMGIGKSTCHPKYRLLSNPRYTHLDKLASLWPIGMQCVLIYIYIYI